MTKQEIINNIKNEFNKYYAGKEITLYMQTEAIKNKMAECWISREVVLRDTVGHGIVLLAKTPHSLGGIVKKLENVSKDLLIWINKEVKLENKAIDKYKNAEVK